MSFPIKVYLLAAAGGGLISALALPVWRACCYRIGLVDEPGGRKTHAQPVALAGGLAIWTALALSLLGITGLVHSGWWDEQTTEKILYGLSRRWRQILAIFFGATGMVVLGSLDDKHELRAGYKFVGQLLIALIVALAGIRITLFVPSLVFSYLVTVFWILTLINAFNFMDNMNGLCAGLGLIAAGLFGLTAALRGQYLVAMIAFLTAGALLGFLPYNFPRATAFLGDSGSHLIGFLMAVLAILPHFYTRQNPKHWLVFSPLLILAVPLLDLVWVVWIRWRLRQPFYMGDNNHLSHRLVRRGLSPTQAVLVIWLVATLVGTMALIWI